MFLHREAYSGLAVEVAATLLELSANPLLFVDAVGTPGNRLRLSRRAAQTLPGFWSTLVGSDYSHMVQWLRNSTSRANLVTAWLVGHFRALLPCSSEISCAASLEQTGWRLQQSLLRFSMTEPHLFSVAIRIANAAGFLMVFQ
jgi:hypothetical protein